jgi:metallo-beta-lactamase family protein
LIIGYQAQGTLGRRLYEGAKRVQIHGEDVRVNCNIKAVGALSAHGDQKKMLQWFGSGIKAPKEIYFVHGEPHASTELAHRAKDLYGMETFVAEMGETVEV